jgi:hypothetical protein
MNLSALDSWASSDSRHNPRSDCRFLRVVGRLIPCHGVLLSSDEKPHGPVYRSDVDDFVVLEASTIGANRSSAIEG